jgi:hypothetical protein
MYLLACINCHYLKHTRHLLSDQPAKPNYTNKNMYNSVMHFQACENYDESKAKSKHVEN